MRSSAGSYEAGPRQSARRGARPLLSRSSGPRPRQSPPIASRARVACCETLPRRSWRTLRRAVAPVGSHGRHGPSRSCASLDRFAQTRLGSLTCPGRSTPPSGGGPVRVPHAGEAFAWQAGPADDGRGVDGAAQVGLVRARVPSSCKRRTRSPRPSRACPRPRAVAHRRRRGGVEETWTP